MPDGPAFKPHDDHLDQGDIFSDVPLVKWQNGKPVLASCRAVITAHGCACEDYERALSAGKTQKAAKMTLHVAPLRTTRDVPGHRLEEIRSGKQLDYFYLYGTGTILTDQLLDFSKEQPVPASVLMGCTKIARLADWQWRRLLVHQTVSRFHQSPETLFLPPVIEGNALAG